MKIALTLIMVLVDFFILPMWTLKDKLVLISKPKMKAEVEPAHFRKTKIATTIPAINLPIVIEKAAIFLTSKKTLLLQIAFNNFSSLKLLKRHAVLTN
jgi:hypothetical protein